LPCRARASARRNCSIGYYKQTQGISLDPPSPPLPDPNIWASGPSSLSEGIHYKLSSSSNVRTRLSCTDQLHFPVFRCHPGPPNRPPAAHVHGSSNPPRCTPPHPARLQSPRPEPLQHRSTDHLAKPLNH